MLKGETGRGERKGVETALPCARLANREENLPRGLSLLRMRPPSHASGARFMTGVERHLHPRHSRRDEKRDDAGDEGEGCGELHAAACCVSGW